MPRWDPPKTTNNTEMPQEEWVAGCPVGELSRLAGTTNVGGIQQDQDGRAGAGKGEVDSEGTYLCQDRAIGSGLWASDPVHRQWLEMTYAPKPSPRTPPGPLLQLTDQDCMIRGLQCSSGADPHG